MGRFTAKQDDMRKVDDQKQRFFSAQRLRGSLFPRAKAKVIIYYVRDFTRIIMHVQSKKTQCPAERLPGRISGGRVV
jgi:hypothetical protein